jgi:hypothetical protein
MSRRPLLVLPAVLAAMALPVAPALAGEDDDDSGPATLRAPQGCISGDHSTAAVTGDNIDRVVFWLDGDRIKTMTQPNARGRFSWTVNCDHLSAGAHRARAVVSFEQGSSPASQTLRFQITRARQGSGSPRFTG